MRARRKGTSGYTAVAASARPPASPERPVGTPGRGALGEPPVEPGPPGQRLDPAAFVEGVPPYAAIGPGQRAKRQVKLEGVDVFIPGQKPAADDPCARRQGQRPSYMA